MAVQQNGQEDPDPDPDPDPEAPPGFVKVWSAMRPLLPLAELLGAGQHKGLHLAVQALLVLGDLAVMFSMRRR